MTDLKIIEILEIINDYCYVIIDEVGIPTQDVYEMHIKSIDRIDDKQFISEFDSFLVKKGYLIPYGFWDHEEKTIIRSGYDENIINSLIIGSSFEEKVNSIKNIVDQAIKMTGFIENTIPSFLVLSKYGDIFKIGDVILNHLRLLREIGINYRHTDLNPLVLQTEEKYYRTGSLL